VLDADGKITGVDVILTKWESRVQLALDGNDNLKHMNDFDRQGGPSKTVQLGTLSITDLEAQAKMNQLFYENAVPYRQQVDRKKKPLGQWVLDSSSDKYAKPKFDEIIDARKSLVNLSMLGFISFHNLNSISKRHKYKFKTIADPSTSSSICPGSSTRRRKRSTGSSCIVFNKPTDDADTEKTILDDKILNDDPKKNVDQPEKTKVEEIEGNKFVSEYDGMDSQSKQQIAEITKNNKNKVIADSSETTQKLNKIIELEDIKSHSSRVDYSKSVHANGDIPKIAHVPRVPDFSTPFNLMKNTKISQSKFVRGLATIGGSKFGSKLLKGADKVSNPIGKFLLVKNIIKGIQSEDYVSLGITGAKIGLDLGIDKIISHGTKVFQKTGKMSKFTKLVGKWGGPFSAVVDVGLSVWGITKAVQRLNNPSATKFERNEAIADIVQDSIDIVVTSAVASGSLAFPPFAPIFATVGVVVNLLATLSVALYKASNQVDSLDDKLKLLDFEKTTEYLRYFTGQDTSHYLDSLIFTKTANNLITGHYEQILRETPNMFGIAFPSRTSTVSRECTLHFQHCNIDASIFVGGPCLTWSDFSVIGKKCYLNDDCLEYIDKDWKDWSSSYKYNVRKCVNQAKTVVAKNAFGISRDIEIVLKCACDKPPTTTWGFPERNSIVDFRSKSHLWPQRDIPDNLKHSQFKCRPNTESDYGYQFSNRQTKYEYKCENAIAIIDNSRVGNNANYFSIDLGEGRDEVYMPELSRDSNIFRVEDGVKKFIGGGGVDQFVINGKCKSLSGILDGGGGTDDSLIISESCSPSKPIIISSDSKSGLAMKSEEPDKILNIYNVESIIGREGFQEIVNVSCNTRSLMLQGGQSSWNPDDISIPTNTPSCPYNLTIQVKGHTKIQSEALQGEITIAVLKARDDQASFLASILMAPTISHKLFLDIAAFEVDPITIRNNNISKNLMFSFKNRFNNQRFTIQFDSKVNNKTSPNKPRMVLAESEGQNSLLTFDEGGNVVVVHQLLSQQPGRPYRKESLNRKGSPSIPNEFHLITGQWNVQGGAKSNDIFYVYPECVGLINGGGGSNTLQTMGSNPVSILYGWNVESRHSSNCKNKTDCKQSIQAVNIQRILGRPGWQDKLTVFGFPPQSNECQDQIVISLAGGDKNIPDIITTGNHYKENEFYCLPPLKIAVVGYTIAKLDILMSQTLSPVLFFIRADIITNSLDFKFDLEMADYNNGSNPLLQDKLLFYIELDLSSLSEAIVQQIEEVSTRKLSISSINLKFLENQVMSLNFAKNSCPVTPNILFLEEGQVIAQLVIHEREGIVVHSLDNHENHNSSKTRRGASGVSNHFYLNGGNWSVAGGQKDDTFNLMSDEISGTLDGGSSGENRLVLGPELALSKEIFIDLLSDNQYLNAFGTTTTLQLKNMNLILGRSGQQETILCGQDTKYVDGGGGSSADKADLIVISNSSNETNALNITVKGMDYTNIENNATHGQFKYIVSSETTSVNSSAGLNATELLQLNLPMESLKLVQFTKTSEIAGQLRIQMQSRYKHNLQIPFVTPNSHETKRIQIVQENQYRYSGVLDYSLRCEIRVRPDESLYTSIVLHSNVHIQSLNSVEGIPGVDNNFIVELHRQTHLKSIKGSSKDDHFWIYSAKSIDSLDGGGEGDDENSLHIFDYFFHGQDLLVDLRMQPNFGSITLLKDGEETDQKAIETLRSIQVFHGRPNMYDKVLVTCDTSFVANAEEILITDDECDFYSLTMKVTPGLVVDFKRDVYFEGVFVYQFDQPGPILVKGLESISTDETYSKHVFRLSFVTVPDLEDLWFNGTHLIYKTEEEVDSNSHAVLSEPGNLEEFYPHEFVTGDNFVIQITKFGTILLTVGSTWPKEIDLDLVDNIQLKYVPEMEETAKRLGVTIIAKTNTDYLTAGYVSNSQDAGDHNVLTNGPLRSHLIGCGSNRTVYEIVSLDSDVFIYPGIISSPGFNSSNIGHTLDMTDIVAAIRLKTETKFIPTVHEDGMDLVVSITGYESEFPGRIIIVNGVQEASHLDVLFNSAMMEIVPLSSLKPTTRRRRKREINTQSQLNSLWTFHPKQIIVQAGSVFTISPEDLEEGHEIVMSNLDSASNRKFKLVRDGNDLYMTTLGSLTEWDSKLEELTTIVLADYFDAAVKPELFPGEMNLTNDTSSERAQPSPKFVDVSFKLEENITVLLNDTEIIRMTENTAGKVLTTPLQTDELETWEDLLVQSETEVLKNFPEVTHRFFSTKSHFNAVQIFHYKFEIGEEHMNFIYIGASITGWIFVVFILCVLKHILTWNNTMEVNEKPQSLT